MTIAAPSPGEETLTIPCSHGYNLVGTLFVRDSTRDLIVICHGILNTRRSKIIRGLCGGLPYNVFAFDFEGNGDSGGVAKYGNYDEEVENLHDVVGFLRSHQWNVRCLMGHSRGGAVVLRHASKHNDVPLIVNIAGRYDHSQAPSFRFSDEQRKSLAEQGSFVWCPMPINGRDYVVTREDMEKRCSLDMSIVARIDGGRTRVLIIHGECDKTIPVKDAYKFQEMIENSELQVVPGADHMFRTEEEARQLLDALNGWLAKSF
ncbi:uncharacterized protein VTP21DRAFT_3127 [Calcarisporiella thermophila]|uniref:uncharacterized protein n=1 Tax=Calcarisporiella thermophila TaxID=911321 RepID=UPI003741F129